MKRIELIALAAAAFLGACANDQDGYRGRDRDGWGYYDQESSRRYGQYDWNRPDPRAGGYYADNYYRNDSRYRERRLSRNDRLYAGRDGRVYCRRSDGTTGLIVGGIAGGVLGNVIAPGGSKTLGTVLGAIGGAAIGNAVDRNSDDVRCQ
jgi:hypothetical protein